MARSALTVAAFVAAALVVATAQAKTIDFSEDDLASEDSIWELYERWAAHNKVARDPGEKSRRFPIFKKNARMIHELNQRDARNNVGLDIFGDMTAEEITNFTTCFTYPTPSYIPEHFVDMPAVAASDEPAIPVSVDWREKRAVTYVKDQGDCGACWAFAATGAVEGIYSITIRYDYVVLSEQMLVDCDSKNNGCSGGTPWAAFDFIVKFGGIPSEFVYPYRGTEGSCDLDKISPSATLNGWARLGSNNAPALMRAVAAQPVAVAIGIDHNFDWYSGKDIYKGPGNTTLVHAVLVVGYGTNEQGENYWIVKNSWGADWGDKGYIYISRDHGGEEGLCGILTAPSYPIMNMPM